MDEALAVFVAEGLLEEFGPKLHFVFAEAGFDVLLLALVGNHILAVALEEVADGFDADLDGTGGLVLVNVLEAEVRGAAAFDDLFDRRVDRGVVAAFEAGEFERDERRREARFLIRLDRSSSSTPCCNS